MALGAKAIQALLAAGVRWELALTSLPGISVDQAGTAFIRTRVNPGVMDDAGDDTFHFKPGVDFQACGFTFPGATTGYYLRYCLTDNPLDDQPLMVGYQLRGPNGVGWPGAEVKALLAAPLPDGDHCSPDPGVAYKTDRLGRVTCGVPHAAWNTYRYQASPYSQALVATATIAGVKVAQSGSTKKSAIPAIRDVTLAP